MKKRMIALLMVLMLCLTLLPVSAFAGDPALVSGTGSGVSPLTGDSSNIMLWVLIVLVALAALVVIVIFMLRKKKK